VIHLTRPARTLLPPGGCACTGRRACCGVAPQPGGPGGVTFWTQQPRNDDLDENVNDDRVPNSVQDDDDVILVADLLASQEYFQLAQTLATTSFATIPGNPAIVP
jgi:hypothetical protein